MIIKPSDVILSVFKELWLGNIRNDSLIMIFYFIKYTSTYV